MRWTDETPFWLEDPIQPDQEGMIYGDPWNYLPGCTTALLRSGTDGPHTSLADRLCGLSTAWRH